MAQTSRPQSPWQPGQNQNQNQNQDAFMPPAKRQRLSPGPTSPYTHAATTPYANSPNYANISLPNGAFNNTRPNGLAQMDGISHQNAGVMGPPQRPAERIEQKPVLQKEEKPLDVNDLNDLVASSGINLKDEEDFLNASYRSGRNATQGTNAQQAPQQTSFDLLSQNRFGNLGSSRSSFSQEQLKQTEEEELYEKHRRAARIVNESAQYQLNDPFLWGASVRHRMQAIARDNVLGIPINGLWDRISDKPQTMSGSSMRNHNGGGIQTSKAPSMLNSGTPMEPILSLLSLAANERLRSLLEDAYGLARGRQIGADGVVPPQWSDIAVGEGGMQTNVVPKSATGTAWEMQETSVSNEEHSSSFPLPKTSASTPQPAKDKLSTTSFTHNKLNAALMTLSARDRQAEEARLKIRKERREKKAKAAASAASGPPIEAGTPVPSTKSLPAGMLGERAPEVKLTKKEREKASKQDINEEVAAREANITAAMQLGGKKYSWMSGGASKSKQPPKPAVPSRTGMTGGKEKKEGLAAIEDRRFGNWREDGVGGKGVQLRDWIATLEQDRYERKTLAWACTKLDDQGWKKEEPKQQEQLQHIQQQQQQEQQEQQQQQQPQQPQPLQEQHQHQQQLQAGQPSQPPQPNGVRPT